MIRAAARASNRSWSVSLQSVQGASRRLNPRRPLTSARRDAPQTDWERRSGNSSGAGSCTSFPRTPFEADEGICFPEKDSEFKNLLNPKEISKPPLERRESNRFRIQGLLPETWFLKIPDSAHLGAQNPLPKTILAKRPGRLRAEPMIFPPYTPNPARFRRGLGVFPTEILATDAPTHLFHSPFPPQPPFPRPPDRPNGSFRSIPQKANS